MRPLNLGHFVCVPPRISTAVQYTTYDDPKSQYVIRAFLCHYLYVRFAFHLTVWDQS